MVSFADMNALQGFTKYERFSVLSFIDRYGSKYETMDELLKAWRATLATECGHVETWETPDGMETYSGECTKQPNHAGEHGDWRALD